MTSPAAYTDVEINAIGGWLVEGFSAGKIAERFSNRFRHISRNAVIGIVTRNPTLKAIGFVRTGHGGGARKASGSACAGAIPKASAAVRLPPSGRPQPLPPTRSVAEMIDGLAAPMMAKAPEPRRLAELVNRQCRFPLSGEGAATLFCASPVEPHAWMPGLSGGCYCRFHRALTTRAPGSEAA